MKRYWIGAATLAAGCVTTQTGYEDRLEAWIGATETELVAEFGSPARIVEAPDGKMLYWEYSTERAQTTGPAPVGGGVTMRVGVMTTYRCHLSFGLLDGQAESFRWRATRSGVFREGEFDSPTAWPCDEAFPAHRE